MAWFAEAQARRRCRPTMNRDIERIAGMFGRL
jgi:hypothetical protein